MDLNEPRHEKKTPRTFRPINISVYEVHTYLVRWLKFPLGLPLTRANSIGSGETERMHRLA